MENKIHYFSEKRDEENFNFTSLEKFLARLSEVKDPCKGTIAAYGEYEINFRKPLPFKIWKVNEGFERNESNNYLNSRLILYKPSINLFEGMPIATKGFEFQTKFNLKTTEAHYIFNERDLIIEEQEKGKYYHKISGGNPFIQIGDNSPIEMKKAHRNLLNIVENPFSKRFSPFDQKLDSLIKLEETILKNYKGELDTYIREDKIEAIYEILKSYSKLALNILKNSS